jgi:angiogenesis inhibitor 2
MCRDEYVMLMTWKKAAAGEIIYNKCPPNASGKGKQLSLETLSLPRLLLTSGRSVSEFPY